MSGSYGPFATRPGILQRSTDFVDLVIRNTPEMRRLRLWGARTLDDAYGNLVGSGVGGAGCSQLMEGDVGTIIQTPSVSARWRVEESRRGNTSFQFDVRDFALAPGSIGSDDEYLFVRVQEMRKTTNAWFQVAAGPNAGWDIQGPILLIPTAKYFFGMGGAAVIVEGTAPAGTLCTFGHIPNLDETVTVPLPMHIIFPRPLTSVQIRNLDLANNLLVSFGLGMPMTRIVQAGSDIAIFGAPGVTEIVLAGEGGPCEFSVEGVIDRYD